MAGLSGKLAGLLTELKGLPITQRLASKGGAELLRSSVPGAVVTAGLGAVTTGNPLAGVAIGLTDLGLSYGTSRAISEFAPNLAGKYRAYVSPEQIAEAEKAGKAISTAALKQVYEPSALQQTAMLAGSIGAPLALEPLFMPQQEDVSNQNVTQQQQLGQQEYLNHMYAPPYTADGTLYQLQGLPDRVVR